MEYGIYGMLKRCCVLNNATSKHIMYLTILNGSHMSLKDEKNWMMI